MIHESKTIPILRTNFKSDLQYFNLNFFNKPALTKVPIRFPFVVIGNSYEDLRN